MLIGTEKHIGTIGPYIFQNKILIIDYPHNRICVCDQLPKQFNAATFQPLKTTIAELKFRNHQWQDRIFALDTGSSIFTVTTTKDNVLTTADAKIVDSLVVSKWGKYLTFYGVKPISNKVWYQES